MQHFQRRLKSEVKAETVKPYPGSEDTSITTSGRTKAAAAQPCCVSDAGQGFNKKSKRLSRNARLRREDAPQTCILPPRAAICFLAISNSPKKRGSIVRTPEMSMVSRLLLPIASRNIGTSFAT